jgi:WD40 repeat protein
LLREDLRMWRAPKWKMVVFVSSTFIDTQHERNVLLEKIQPELRKIGRPHGIEVTFVDMRWGIRDESTIDHNTWEECKKAIDRCEEDSDGLFFLSLQSERFGYLPLPKYLSEDEMLSRVSSSDTKLHQLATGWYIKDINSEPHRYVLRSQSKVNDAEFENARPGLLELFDGLAVESASSGGLKVGQSVTEWEVRYALSKGKSRDRCLWLHRKFRDDVTETSDTTKLFCDAFDPSVRPKLDTLKAWMTEKIPLDRIRTTTVPLTHYLDKWETNVQRILQETQELVVEEQGQMRAAESSAWSQRLNSLNTFIQGLPMNPTLIPNLSLIHYLDEWRKDVQGMLSRELEKIITMKDRWNANGDGVGMSGDILADILHHSAWAHEKCFSFVGREQLIDQITNQIWTSGSSNKDNPFGVAVALVAASGSGKTGLMAKLAQRLYTEENVMSSTTRKCLGRPVIIRFCGTNSASSTGLNLVRSICHQIQFLTVRRRDYASVPIGYQDAVTLLHELLASFPVILLIDSLDQLSDDKPARSRLSFLYGVKPHKDTRIIVSTLPDKLDNDGNKHFYGFETALIKSNCCRVEIPVQHDEKARRGVIELLLGKDSRRLTDKQWNVLLTAVYSEPSMLCMSLATRLARSWRSSDENIVMDPKVIGIINNTLQSVEYTYGVRLVRMALALLTFSKAGLSDNEMEDLLSLREDILNDVFQYNRPTIRRLPSHVWLRVRDALSGLLVERDGGCVMWYHRQLREEAETRYVPEKKRAHKLLALYFGDLLYEHIKLSKLTAPQTLVLTEEKIWYDMARVNTRRCVEASNNMIEAGMLLEALNELCNCERICGMVKAGEGFVLLANLLKILELLRSRSYDSHLLERTDHYIRWLRQCLTTIIQDPSYFIPDTCTVSQPLCSLARQELMAYFMKHSSEPTVSTLKTCTVRTRVIPRSMGGRDKYDSLLMTLQGNWGGIQSVVWSADDRKILAACGDNIIRLWDSSLGSLMKIFVGHTSSVMDSQFSPDSSKIVSASQDQTVCLWNANTGLLVRQLNGHTSRVDCVDFHPDGRHIVSGSWDETVRIWNIDSFELPRVIEALDRVASVAWSPDGTMVACCCVFQKVAKIWTLSTEELIFEFKHHPDDFTVVKWSPCGSRLATLATDNVVRIWNLKPQELPVEINTGIAVHDSVRLYDIAWSPDGNSIATAHGNSTMLWDAFTGAKLLSLPGYVGCAGSIGWSHDGRCLVGGERWFGGTIHIWDIQSDLQNPGTLPAQKFFESCSVSWNSDGILQVGTNHGAQKYEVATGRSIQAIMEPEEECWKFSSWSPDGQLVAAGASYQVWVFNGVSGDVLHTWDQGQDGKFILCWSPDSSMIAFPSRMEACSLEIRNIATGLTISRCGELDGRFCSVAWSPDCHRIACTSEDKYIRIWNPSTGSLIWETVVGIPDAVLCWSPDGRFLASSISNKSVAVWDSQGWNLSKELATEQEDFVKLLSWSSDGNKLAAGYGRGLCFIRIWDVATSSVCVTFYAGPHDVSSMAFNPSCTMLATGSMDGIARIWSCW